MNYSYAFLVLLLPFLSFLVLGLAGMKMKKQVAAIIGTVLMGCVFGLSIYTAYEYFLLSAVMLQQVCIPLSTHSILLG